MHRLQTTDSHVTNQQRKPFNVKKQNKTVMQEVRAPLAVPDPATGGRVEMAEKQ